MKVAPFPMSAGKLRAFTGPMDLVMIKPAAS
jgi:hypothetical protein